MCKLKRYYFLQFHFISSLVRFATRRSSTCVLSCHITVISGVLSSRVRCAHVYMGVCLGASTKHPPPTLPGSQASSRQGRTSHYDSIGKGRKDPPIKHSLYGIKFKCYLSYILNRHDTSHRLRLCGLMSAPRVSMLGQCRSEAQSHSPFPRYLRL
jgi:hypothetical protein